MTQTFLDHELECPNCGTIRMRIPDDVTPFTLIRCNDCGAELGRWAELERSFAEQGGQSGVFAVDQGRFKRID